jgi:hypothetical protein
MNLLGPEELISKSRGQELEVEVSGDEEVGYRSGIPFEQVAS